MPEPNKKNTGFVPLNDSIDGFEAPPAQGFLVDINGSRWDSKPDNVVDKYMSKVALTQNEYWKYKEYFNAKKWFELEMFLDRLANSATEEDAARIVAARKVVTRIQGLREDER